MEWLERHMRNHLAEVQGESNVLSLRSQPTPIEDVGVRALDLVERAIQYIRDTEQAAAERHARADTLARGAIEELKSAGERVRTAEAGRRAAEALADETIANLREVEIAAQARISAAEERARAAEKRATKAENALKQIETTVHALLFDQRLSMTEAAA